jgi:hypothetical protein
LLSDTTSHLTNLTRIGTLYADSSGIPTVSGITVNWLTHLTWATGDTFLAIGQNLNPNGTARTLGVVRGAIGAGAAQLTMLPETEFVRHFSLAGAQGPIVFVDSTLIVRSVAKGGGSITDIVTLPPQVGRQVGDISCRADTCAVLTLEQPSAFPDFPFGGATIWKVDMTTRTVASVRRLSPPIPSALALSPSSGDVAILQSGQLYLLKGLFPLTPSPAALH